MNNAFLLIFLSCVYHCKKLAQRIGIVLSSLLYFMPEADRWCPVCIFPPAQSNAWSGYPCVHLMPSWQPDLDLEGTLELSGLFFPLLCTFDYNLFLEAITIAGTLDISIAVFLTSSYPAIYYSFSSSPFTPSLMFSTVFFGSWCGCLNLTYLTTLLKIPVVYHDPVGDSVLIF